MIISAAKGYNEALNILMLKSYLSYLLRLSKQAHFRQRKLRAGRHHKNLSWTFCNQAHIFGQSLRQQRTTADMKRNMRSAALKDTK
jgi:hypothetical protein